MQRCTGALLPDNKVNILVSLKLLKRGLSCVACLHSLVNQAGVGGGVGRLELLDQLELSRVSDDLGVLRCMMLECSACCSCIC